MLQRRVRFTLADLLTSGAAGLLLVAGVVAGVPARAPWAMAQVAAAFLLPFAFAAIRARDPRPGAVLASVADFGPILPLLLVFDNLGPFILGTSRVDLDPFLVAADRFLFLGADPTRLSPGLSSTRRSRSATPSTMSTRSSSGRACGGTTSAGAPRGPGSRGTCSGCSSSST
ncbi:MAG: hypothetical protein KJ062_09825 [Thermoanaerobaculia bacterium]|nr:hypothetical protein [Thermoanaerobaculia bacterium]